MGDGERVFSFPRLPSPSFSPSTRVSSEAERRIHNPQDEGSIPPPATKKKKGKRNYRRANRALLDPREVRENGSRS